MLRRLGVPAAVLFTSFTLLLGAASAAGAGPALLRSGTTAPAPATTVLRVRPVGPQGHLRHGYTVTERQSGANCWTSSEATGSAYRCMAGNAIYDPCWVGASRHVVFCLEAPWSRQVMRLHVTKGYDNQGFPWAESSSPWGLRTTSGTRCALLQGASGVVHNQRVNYGCQGTTAVLVGDVDTSHPVWRIRTARDSGGGHYRITGWVNLSKAWFGRATRKG